MRGPARAVLAALLGAAVLGLSTVPPAAGSPAADRRGHKHSHGTIQVYRQAAVFAAPSTAW